MIWQNLLFLDDWGRWVIKCTSISKHFDLYYIKMDQSNLATIIETSS